MEGWVSDLIQGNTVIALMSVPVKNVVSFCVMFIKSLCDSCSDPFLSGCEGVNLFPDTGVSTD